MRRPAPQELLRRRPLVEPRHESPARAHVAVASAFALAVVVGSVGCSSRSASSALAAPFDGGAGDPADVPLDGVTREQVALFDEGDELFDLTLRDYDGLGPLYTRTSCGACHEGAARGPGFVQKMSVVLADGVTAADDQTSTLPFGNTVHPLVTAGAKTPIVPPPGDARVKVTTRVGPPVLGRGYLEAILDAEIERVAAEEALRTDGVHGRVNHVVYASEESADTSFHAHKKGDVVIGRFGLKARIGTLDDFTADAMQGDMGITSPLRPQEIPNPDGLTDDLRPGVDVTLDSVNKRAIYMRLVAIPRRSASAAGGALFARATCDACHVPSLKTRADYPIAPLAGIDAPVYTDLLLHDMGDALADGTRAIDGEATSRDWRTAPLIGLRFSRSFLHDGRARSIREAILLHDGSGSEANASVRRFAALSPEDQATLVDFVGEL